MNYISEHFGSWTPVVCHYSNGRLAVEYQSESADVPGWMESECVATVNLPDVHIEHDEVCIKDYSENEGIYECMVAAGHISPATRYTSSGFVDRIPICKLLLEH